MARSFSFQGFKYSISDSGEIRYHDGIAVPHVTPALVEASKWKPVSENNLKKDVNTTLVVSAIEHGWSATIQGTSQSASGPDLLSAVSRIPTVYKFVRVEDGSPIAVRDYYEVCTVLPVYGIARKLIADNVKEEELPAKLRTAVGQKIPDDMLIRAIDAAIQDQKQLN